MDMKLEVVVVPVSDVDRAKDFYKRLGFREDIDYDSGNGYRIVQLTPPGSGCSIIFGKGITSAQPGSIDRLVLAVHDAVVAVVNPRARCRPLQPSALAARGAKPARAWSIEIDERNERLAESPWARAPRACSIADFQFRDKPL